MPAGASARRYAQAAFEIAVDMGDTEQWMDDLTQLADSITDERFRQVLSAPRIPFARKADVIQEMFGFVQVQRREYAAFWTKARRKEAAVNPAFWTDERREEAARISRGDNSVGLLAINLMLLLTSRNLVHLLPSIADRFQELLDAHNGVERAEAVSAVPLDDGQRDKITLALSEMTGKDVRLTVRADPEILGGMIIRIGDRVLDGSARTRLQSMRRELAQRR